ncbi:gluconate 2-dehydrogenase subunit 3 family protein [Virgibacillus sp. NKC19-3]|uniref:gluconate 2-dehydrogenase subunit 3 family protein n=1 Tax=Virgibacillus saliphilus TaxID=2831674 RepID=UPI001C9AFD4D|nr:gluconate 2-dehydrogenase subunit 3 family protein [Virgibacillus sp. NKC19-3]MBY7142315.1 gluconate 2-dehydrogenase subunit 3 family protein [Virgibacillus sp. NKC19-3]
MADESKGTKISRRKFVKNSGYVAGGVVGGGLIGSLLGVNFGGTEQTSTAPAQETKFNQALMYFTRQADFNTLGAATERIFPTDDNGPGALELGVPYFIDHQLAGAYGNNDNEYMQGPFYTGTPFQGYQSALKRHEIFMQGIRALDRESEANFNDSFTNLEEEQQDEILQSFEADEVELKGVTSSEFFEMLRTATLAGAYSDPLYGGNDDMEGWKMKEYPGSQMSYINEIEDDDFKEIEPSALNEHL